MRTYFIIFVALILVGCKSYHVENYGFHQELKKKFIETSISDECLEKASHFEDVYLSDIKNLKGYSWDKERYTASFEITNNKRGYITIAPQGVECNSIRKTVTFVQPRDFSFEENKEEVLHDLIWISKKLCNEDEFKVVEQALKKVVNSNSYRNDDTFIFLYPELNFDDPDSNFTTNFNEFTAIFYKELDSSRYSIMYLFQ
ncbi:hypothetical protein L3X39_12620 [Sabulilitoribacter multivorans]|uniref:Lipoprotein n=1 Tax=Flaviramulus multivorans TaxID=1304750 RepID=A0ABS9ILK6_9FLAO|nr:hypothetical protein [Flaviramulus multivorans]MCF7561483.1 hypothetical protein [Flaviramulus multivorans]